MKSKLGYCKTFPIGSFPQGTAAEAMKLCMESFDIPCWPQLPKLGFNENMYAQFNEGISPLVLKDDKIYADTTDDERIAEQVDKILNDFMQGETKDYAISEEFSKGLYHFFGEKDALSKREFIKGQITGPISFCLQVTDQDKKPILYDELLFEGVTQALALKAQWMLDEMKKINKNVIIAADEPFLSSFGSAYISLTKEQVIESANTVFGRLDCIRSMHCCANTNWSIPMQTDVDIICFDAYEYAKNLLLYPQELKKFIDDGKFLGWGIVPSSNDLIAKEDAQSLFKRFNGLVKEFAAKGIDQDKMLRQSVLTPSCGVGSLTEEASIKVCRMIKELSKKIRNEYSLEGD